MIQILDKAGELAKSYLPVILTQYGRKMMANPRFIMQRNIAREGYRKFGNRYPQNVLFVAGMPKSGTTWLEKMLSGFDGFQDVMIPEAVYHEYHNDGSHNFDIPKDSIDRLKNSLAVLKLHTYGSANNVQILKKAGINYVVIFRDIRDVAVSHIFYVYNTPWHPEHKKYMSMASTADVLCYFGQTLLEPFREWVESWEAVDDDKCLVIRYEDLRENTLDVFWNVVQHYGLTGDKEMVRKIVEKNTFENLSKGRTRGEEDNTSFFRKGVVGDWDNHFDERAKNIFKEVIGDYLIRRGYEKDKNW